MLIKRHLAALARTSSDLTTFPTSSEVMEEPDPMELMSIDFPIDNTEDIEDAHNPWTEGSENESVDLDKIYESEMISEAENIDNSPHNS